MPTSFLKEHVVAMSWGSTVIRRCLASCSKGMWSFLCVRVCWVEKFVMECKKRNYIGDQKDGWMDGWMDTSNRVLYVDRQAKFVVVSVMSDDDRHRKTCFRNE